MRLQVFERLAKRPLSVGKIAAGLPVSRPAVSQHLKVLKQARLVSCRRDGARSVYSVDPHGIEAIRTTSTSSGIEHSPRSKQQPRRMTNDYQEAADRRSPDLEKAFRVFTAQMTTWWPKMHHIGASPLKECIVEPRVEGRWYELCEDGSQCDWGRVLAWDSTEPPRARVAAKLRVQVRPQAHHRGRGEVHRAVGDQHPRRLRAPQPRPARQARGQRRWTAAGARSWTASRPPSAPSWGESLEKAGPLPAVRGVDR